MRELDREGTGSVNLQPFGNHESAPGLTPQRGALTQKKKPAQNAGFLFLAAARWEIARKSVVFSARQTTSVGNARADQENIYFNMTIVLHPRRGLLFTILADG
jgi:hypothetical protein